MKANIESTTRLVNMMVRCGTNGHGMPARIWQGVTEGGVKFYLFVTRVAVGKNADNAQFEAELKEMAAPSAEAESFPLRMIL
jgi:hypothetical protein